MTPPDPSTRLLVQATVESLQAEVRELRGRLAVTTQERDRWYAETERLKAMAIMFDHATTCTIYVSIGAAFEQRQCNCGWEDEPQTLLRHAREEIERLRTERTP